VALSAPREARACSAVRNCPGSLAWLHPSSIFWREEAPQGCFLLPEQVEARCDNILCIGKRTMFQLALHEIFQRGWHGHSHARDREAVLWGVNFKALNLKRKMEMNHNRRRSRRWTATIYSNAAVKFHGVHG
jgi:hypothetical protein